MVKNQIRPRNLPGLSPVKGVTTQDSHASAAAQFGDGDALDELEAEELEEIYLDAEEQRRHERGTGTSLLRDALDISALLVSFLSLIHMIFKIPSKSSNAPHADRRGQCNGRRLVPSLLHLSTLRPMELELLSLPGMVGVAIQRLAPSLPFDSQ